MQTLFQEQLPKMPEASSVFDVELQQTAIQRENYATQQLEALDYQPDYALSRPEQVPISQSELMRQTSSNIAAVRAQEIELDLSRGLHKIRSAPIKKQGFSGWLMGDLLTDVFNKSAQTVQDIIVTDSVRRHRISRDYLEREQAAGRQIMQQHGLEGSFFCLDQETWVLTTDATDETAMQISTYRLLKQVVVKKTGDGEFCAVDAAERERVNYYIRAVSRQLAEVVYRHSPSARTTPASPIAYGSINDKQSEELLPGYALVA